MSTLWKKALPIPVRQAVAHLPFNKDNFDIIVETADKVYLSGRPSGVTVAALQSATVAALQAAQASSSSYPGQFQTPTSPSPHDTAFIANATPEDPVQAAAQSIVAAVRGFRGSQRGGRGNGGRGQ